MMVDLWARSILWPPKLKLQTIQISWDLIWILWCQQNSRSSQRFHHHTCIGEGYMMNHIVEAALKAGYLHSPIFCSNFKDLDQSQLAHHPECCWEAGIGSPMYIQTWPIRVLVLIRAIRKFCLLKSGEFFWLRRIVRLYVLMLCRHAAGPENPLILPKLRIYPMDRMIQSREYSSLLWLSLLHYL